MKMTVAGTATKLVVDPGTYSKVDITDFAPRAISGTPSFSTLGLYLDVAQEGFGHGFGKYDFGEPKSYSYSGHQIDTRHGHIQLYTDLSVMRAATASWQVYDMAFANDGTTTIPIMVGTDGIQVYIPSDNSIATFDEHSLDFKKILNTGKYFFLSSAGRMARVWIGQPTSAGATSATFTGAGFEDTDQWITSGYAWVFDGTGVGSKVAISASDATSVTVASWPSGTPSTDSWIMLIGYTGNAGNPPNNYDSMTLFGGSAWAAESDTNYLHFWGETNGSDAEGDGTTDAGVITCGPPGGTIVNLHSYKNQLYVFRTDGVWVINEQDTDALAYHTLDFGAETHADNFKSAMVWQGFLTYSIRQNLYKYRSGQQVITPPVWDEYPPYKQFGNFRGLMARGSYMYVLGQSNVANATEEAGTEAATGFVSLLATNGVGWHKLMDLPVTTPSDFNMWLDPYGDYIYLYAYDSITKGTSWRIPLQGYSDLPSATYPTTGTQNWYSSYHTFGMRRVPKSYGSVTLHGEFPTNTSVTIFYRRDDTTTWTQLGSAVTADMTETSFPDGTTGKRIQLKLVLDTTSASVTPIVKAIIIKVMLRPVVLYGITCDIIVSDNISDQRRQQLGHTASDIRTQLLAARSSTAPITLVDLNGDSNSVYLASLRFGIMGYEDTTAVAEVAHCTFVFV
jgi:hypothetical protein